MFIEDNNGFVFLPIDSNKVKMSQGKTLIYLVAFEVRKSEISNVNLTLPGDFVSDDVIDRYWSEDTIKNASFQHEYNMNYFPNVNSDDESIRLSSIKLVSSICIGWFESNCEVNGLPWKATYRDLTNEGRKLYYTVKKLHNNKEVRILTFNNI